MAGIDEKLIEININSWIKWFKIHSNSMKIDMWIDMYESFLNHSWTIRSQISKIQNGDYSEWKIYLNA